MAVNLTVGPTDSSPSPQHLRLRPWRSGDLPELLAAHRDPDVRRWALAPLDDEEQAERWIEDQHEEWAAGSRYSFAIVTADEGSRLAGGIGLKGVEPEKTSAEVGYWVGAAYRGRGVASRALEAVSQWALDLPDGLGLEHLDLLHSVDNPPSCAVAERADYALHSVLPPLLPQFPAKGHLHVRHTTYAP